MARNYCWTLNNPKNRELELLRERGKANCFQYICWQKERGEQGTTHLQGYVEFKRTHRMQGCKTEMGIDRLHVERRRGKQEHAINYCRKKDETTIDNSFEEFGTKARQGHRSDLDEMTGTIMDNPEIGDLELVELYGGGWMRNYRAIGKLRGLCAQRDAKKLMLAGKEPPEVYVYWGPTGTGKSREVRAQISHLSLFHYVQKGTGASVWFDGCDPYVEAIIFDDFYGWVPYDFLLRLCDRYMTEAQIKGGTVPLVNLKYIYFTSNKRWDQWYRFDMAPFARRITKTVHFATPLIRDEDGQGNTGPVHLAQNNIHYHAGNHQRGL